MVKFEVSLGFDTPKDLPAVYLLDDVPQFAEVTAASH